MICFFNNNFCENPHISIHDRGFLLGDGLFETCYVKNKYVAFFDLHLDRLFQGLQILKIPFNKSVEDLKKIIAALILKNNFDESSLRITITRGLSDRGLNINKGQEPTLLITQSPYTRDKKNTLKLKTFLAQEFRKNELSQVKLLNYTDKILARNDAQECNFDDALLFDFEHNILSTTCANIFFITHENKMITPPLSQGVLNGTMRKVLMKHENVEEKTVHKNDLGKMKSAFITNSLIGLQKITAIDNDVFKDFDASSFWQIFDQISLDHFHATSS